MIRKTLCLILLIFLTMPPAQAQPAEIEFGSYWQTYEVDGEKEPLTWLIIDETEDAYLLITKYSVDANVFGLNDNYTTWENSLMREFLSTYFYQEAFSEQEKASILLTLVNPDTNLYFPKTNQGKSTKDYVFLLSLSEVEHYFPEEEQRIVTATDFARIGHWRTFGKYWRGAYTDPDTGATSWRLRTMGEDNFHVCSVREWGEFSYGGDILYAPHYAVRPCIWIKKAREV